MDVVFLVFPGQRVDAAVMFDAGNPLKLYGVHAIPGDEHHRAVVDAVIVGQDIQDSVRPVQLSPTLARAGRPGAKSAAA